jgi:carnosine N-methyltransferase
VSSSCLCELEIVILWFQFNSICNVVKVADTLKTVKIPDIPAVDLIDPSKFDPACPYRPFSFAAGNFVEIYTSPENAGAWDCVVTCFFLDTAPVVIE